MRSFEVVIIGLLGTIAGALIGISISLRHLSEAIGVCK